MLTYNVGFINNEGNHDETQFDIEERNRTEEEVVELINLILSLKNEIGIKEVTYIDLSEEAERTTYTAFAYDDEVRENIVDESMYDDPDEAIAFAKLRNWDEVVNDVTGEVIWERSNR